MLKMVLNAYGCTVLLVVMELVVGLAEIGSSS